MKQDNELSNPWGNNPEQPKTADILRDSEKITADQTMPKANDWTTWSESDKPKASK